MAEYPAIEMLRESVEDVDGQILGLLARRKELVRDIAGLKLLYGLDAHQPDVQAARRLSWAERAEELGLDPALATKIFDVIHTHSVDQQNAVIQGPPETVPTVTLPADL